jgi:pimeloyl-ACP methyl ester carboxylesterase
MSRHRSFRLSRCLAFALSAMMTGCAQMPRQGVTSGGNGALAYALDGPPNPPAVVLQSGLGDGRSTWGGIWPQLIARHRVFAIDRPGYGDSPPSARPRDPCTVAAELREALREAQVPPPFLLVGHSLGALYQYAFARLYPQDTAGLLLLDPTNPAHWATLQRETPSTAVTLRGLRATVFTAAMRAEFDDQSVCMDRLETLPPPTAPSRLLVSTRPGALEGEAFQSALQGLRRDWQQRLGLPAIEPVPNAGHYIHHDAPNLVLQAIDDLASRVRPAPR